MPEIKHGGITLTHSEDIEIPAKAGKMSTEEVARLPRPRLGLGLVTEAVADAMEKAPERFTVPNLTAAQLRKEGRMAEAVDQLISDAEYLLFVLKQANALIDSQAYESLRRVLTFVRGQEKFDPGLAAQVPTLINYFARGAKKAAAETIEKTE